MVSTRSKSGSAPAAATPSPAPTIVKKRNQKPAKSTASGEKAPALKTLPERTILNDSGAHIATATLVTDDAPGLILFTYPRANTGGCTTQATGLSALKDQAAAAGYRIVGASYDSPKSQAAWKVKRAIQVDLLCDTLDIGLLKALGAHKAPKSVKRSVFVFRRGGMDGQADGDAAVLVKYNIAPKDCVQLITEYIEENPCKKADMETDEKEGADQPKGKEVTKDKEAEKDMTAETAA